MGFPGATHNHVTTDRGGSGLGDKQIALHHACKNPKHKIITALDWTFRIGNAEEN